MNEKCLHAGNNAVMKIIDMMREIKCVEVILIDI